jgi:hypothetical protein
MRCHSCIVGQESYDARGDERLALDVGVAEIIKNGPRE